MKIIERAVYIGDVRLNGKVMAMDNNAEFTLQKHLGRNVQVMLIRYHSFSGVKKNCFMIRGKKQAVEDAIAKLKEEE